MIDAPIMKTRDNQINDLNDCIEDNQINIDEYNDMVDNKDQIETTSRRKIKRSWLLKIGNWKYHEKCIQHPKNH